MLSAVFLCYSWEASVLYTLSSGKGAFSHSY